jgi:hypothetical protein
MRATVVLVGNMMRFLRNVSVYLTVYIVLDPTSFLIVISTANMISDLVNYERTDVLREKHS